MKLEYLVVRPLSVNCFIISDNKCDAVVVDPGGDGDAIIDFITKQKLKPLMIINTHGHFDHIGAVAQLKNKYNIPFMMHGDDEFLLELSSETSQMFGLGEIEVPALDEKVQDGDVLDAGEMKFRIIHTPGHSPGGICIDIEGFDSVITGDTLFQESIGRSDFPYANHAKLLDSIRTKIFTLDENRVLYPGHGPSTTVGHEKRHNPFF